ncbi:sigma-54 dependent transcriptional regulator [Ideonella sp. DXS22W]|uniref:Sigma-54 dependent transcriptional regulator n=1 Tax=Pseudaquabacterium inlustre TaxID=2984192 RepID=A0ABU9CNT9_9BURK
MTAPYSLLVVDDEPDLRTLYELTLIREGYDVDSAGTVEEAWTRLGERRYNAVITDMKLPDGNGLDLLRRIEAQGRPEKTLVITAYGSAENAVEALKAGAFDYLTKPVDLRQFRSVVASALGRSVLPSAQGPTPVAPAEAAAVAGPGDALAEAGHPALRRLVGRSAAMQQVRALIERVARGMAPVLVQGESGTGKELVARAIHDVSSRAAMPFVAVNCGAIPEQLLEAEFFGYRKGAFTGAQEDRAGFFQAAQGGTLFLDEIGDLPLAMQSKLLRAIQERSVRPIGAVAEAPVNVRIVSATHKDLAVEVHEGRFRQDLFYRLNVIQIRMPPLRERVDDLADIAAAVLARIATDAGVSPAPRLSPAAAALLARHGFPGNVRELENLLHRAVTLTGGDLIQPQDLGLPDDEGAEAEADEAPDLAPPRPVAPVASPAVPAELPADLVVYLDQVERDVLVRALEKHRFNRTAAGASLGLSLRQMRYRMARLGIQVAEHGGD